MHRASYTVDFKLSVVEWIQSNGKSVRAASKQFGVDRKCIREWLKEREVLGSARVLRGPQKRKLHGGRCPLSQELDRLVLSFILESRKVGREVSDQELKNKALQLSQLLGLPDFKASPSWLKGWKHRNNISTGHFLTEYQPGLLCGEQPKGSSLISHVGSTDEVSLPSSVESPRQPEDCRHGDAIDYKDEQIEVQTGPQPDLIYISNIATPDHTYCKPPLTAALREGGDTYIEDPFRVEASSVHMPYISQPPDCNSLISRTYRDFLDGSLRDIQLQRSQRSFSTLPTYYTVQSSYLSSSDPVIGCTQVEDMCELDIPLEHEEVVITGDDNDGDFHLITSLTSSSSSSSVSSFTPLSSPRWTSPAKKAKLWPTLGCSRTSPVSLPGLQEFADPLTGLLANRLSQPVFPAGPEILSVDVSNTTFPPDDS